MRKLFEDAWRRRLSSSPLQEAVGFGGDGLVLGCGTSLHRLSAGPAGTVTLRPDAAHDRMVALLAIAGRGRLAKAALPQIDAALDHWRHGDRALAAIRLAFARLPRVHDLDEAHTLFLAETALDAGLSPNELLRGVGHARCLPLLKDYNPSQPRVPAGCGRTSGQWTCDAPGVSFAPTLIPAAFKPIADGDGTLRPIPAFLRPQDGDGAESEEDKARRLLDQSIQEQIREGRPLPNVVPGGFEILPGPDAAGAGEANPGTPGTITAPAATPRPAPAPVPKPAPGSGGSSTDTSSRDDVGAPCPPQEDDVGNGANESGDNEEYRLSWRINPEGPTPKYSTWTPNVRSKGYFLPSDTPRGRISYDDCKQRNTPTTLPIPGLRRGDLFEIKAGGWGWELMFPGSSGYVQFENQVKNQNAAVIAEGRGRQIYYCLPNQAVVNKVKELYNKPQNKNSHFLVCP